jgi:subtilisin family serine protease
MRRDARKSNSKIRTAATVAALFLVGLAAWLASCQSAYLPTTPGRLQASSGGQASQKSTDAALDSRVYDRRAIVMTTGTVKSPSAVKSVAAAKGVSYLKPLRAPGVSFHLVRVPEGRDYNAALASLRGASGVAGVWPDVIRHVSFTPDDPQFAGSTTTSWDHQWNLICISAPTAWDTNAGSENVVVAVVDTGCDTTHPDLANQIWVNPHPGASGYPNDIHGYNFFGGNADLTDDPTEPHGTWVSGVIGAQMNNGVGVASVAGGKNTTGQKGVRLMICKVGTANGISDDAIVLALSYAVENGANIINMSFGGPDDIWPEEYLCQYAYAHNIVVVAAGGNYTYQGQTRHVDFPAAYPSVIAVGATTLFDESGNPIPEQLPWFSIVGPEIEVTAPGVNILTTNLGGGYSYMDGTSFASPAVAGFAALIRSASPQLSAQEIRAIIDASVDHLGTAGRNPQFGFGRINMHKWPNLTTEKKIYYKVVPVAPDGTEGVASDPFQNVIFAP